MLLITIHCTHLTSLTSPNCHTVDPKQSAIAIDSHDTVNLCRDTHPVSCPLVACSVTFDDLSIGDHVLCVAQDAPYRRMYQSAVVVEKTAESVEIIQNAENGIVKSNLMSSQLELYRVQYSPGKYSPEDIVQRAAQRLMMGEKRYHALLNNSHHFATWSVSGRENSLGSVIQGLTSRQESCSNGNICDTTPALFNRNIESISDLKAGDHVIKEKQNWIVESIDVKTNTFTAYTYMNKDKRVHKRCLDMNKVVLVSYDEVIFSDMHDCEKVLHQAKLACGNGLWDSDNTFATVIKNGIPCSKENSGGGVSNAIIGPGDHVITPGREHFIVEVVHKGNVFDGYTYDESKGRIVKKTKLTWQETVPYNTHRNSKDIVYDARVAYGSLWKSDDEFASLLKTGKCISFSNSSFIDVSLLNEGFDSETEQVHCKSDHGFFSCTKVTSDICIEDGDHLVLKTASEQDHHVIVCYVEDNHNLIVTPAINELTQRIRISDYSDIYRINYKCSLPGDAVVKRVLCNQARKFFCDLSIPEEQCKLVTWAKVGKPKYFAQLPHNNVIVQKWPFRYERIVSIEDISVGDHLFEPTPLYWFHYLVTEKKSDTELSVIYQLRTQVKEDIHNIDIRNKVIYKVIYPECFPADIAILRARKFLSSRRNCDLEGRMKFVPRAKTGSEDGIFVDVLLNYSLPTSKSQIYSFAQLNPGDYVVYKEKSYWHHCLVHSVTSPSNCHIYELWSSSNVTEKDLNWEDEVVYYRVNYNSCVCIKVEQSLTLAADAVKKHEGLNRQTFVHFTKTLDKTEISIDPLVDDKILLCRERVNSIDDLYVGDHIEWPASSISVVSPGAQHHMFVSERNGTTCSVIHRFRKSIVDHISTKEDNIMDIADSFETLRNRERI
ncbi:hypothetical protein EMCRGX_G027869 [Ephydatia muelleri]